MKKTTKTCFCGDHILETITPNNNIWETPGTSKWDYLDEYLKSLTKVEALAIVIRARTQGGHGLTATRRIQELREHHERRINNVLDILGNKTMTAAQVASKMDWDLDIKDWDQYPLGAEDICYR